MKSRKIRALNGKVITELIPETVEDSRELSKRNDVDMAVSFGDVRSRLKRKKNGVIKRVIKSAVELLKGKKRPLGYITPGGYKKTDKGWVKVYKPETQAPAAPKKVKESIVDDKKLSSERLDIVVDDRETRMFITSYEKKGTRPEWVEKAVGQTKATEGTLDLNKETGEVYLNRFDANVAGKGYTKETLDTVLIYLQKKGFTKFEGYVEHTNMSSKSMLKKLGFEETRKGTDGSYWTKTVKTSEALPKELEKPAVPKEEAVEPVIKLSAEAEVLIDALKALGDEYNELSDKWGALTLEDTAGREKLGRDIEGIRKKITSGIDSLFNSVQNFEEATQAAEMLKESGLSVGISEVNNWKSTILRREINDSTTLEELVSLALKNKTVGSSVLGAAVKKFHRFSQADIDAYVQKNGMQSLVDAGIMKPTQIKALEAQTKLGFDVTVENAKFYAKENFEKIDNKEFNAMVSERFQKLYGITVKGFRKDKRLQLQYVDRLLSMQPPKATVGNRFLRTLVYRKKKKTDRSAMAMYSPSNRKISLLDVGDDLKGREAFDLYSLDTKFAACVFHETAHAINENLVAKNAGRKLMNGFSQLCGWNEFVKGDNIPRDNKKIRCVTWYAETSPSEVFAETYAVYMANKKIIDETLDGKREHILSTYRNNPIEISLGSTVGKQIEFLRKNILGSTLMKSIMSAMGLLKGKALPVGTTHMWTGGMTAKKQPTGRWLVIRKEQKEKVISPTDVIKKEAELLRNLDLSNEELIAYASSTLADGAKLRKITLDVIRGKLSQEEAIKKVKQDLKELQDEEEKDGVKLIIGKSKAPKKGGRLLVLWKAVKGFIKPGHKYKKRTWKDSKWVYEYAEEAEVMGEKSKRTLLLEGLGKITDRFETHLKIYMDKAADDYYEIRTALRELGARITHTGAGVVPIKALAELMKDDKTLSEKIVMNEVAAQILYKHLDEFYADWMEGGLDRKDIVDKYEWEEKQKEVKALTQNYDFTPPKDLRMELVTKGPGRNGKFDGLHAYQKAACNFMLSTKNAIMGLDVGLGKTLIGLTAAEKLKEEKAKEGKKAPTLVVAPREKVIDWYEELMKFFDGKEGKVLLFPASGRKAREALEKMKANGELDKYEYVMVGYGWLSDKECAETLGKCDFTASIIDEAHRIKSAYSNAATNFDEFIREKSEYKWMLTATPIPNRIEEGFTMLGHLGKDVLAGKEAATLEREYRRMLEMMKKAKLRGQTIAADLYDARVQTLLMALRDIFKTKTMIRDYNDEDVHASIPAIQSHVKVVEMYDEQRKIYNFLKDKTDDALRGLITDESQTAMEKMNNAMALLTRLNQITIHPALMFPSYKGRSAKFDFVADEIEEHFDTSTRDRKPDGTGFVVFCEQTKALDMFKEQLIKEKGFKDEDIGVVDMSVSLKKKKQMQEDFNSGKLKILLLGKTGEEGLNLQKNCYKLAHLDIPWVPKTLIQRNGRIARQGQTRPIQIYFPVGAMSSDRRRLSRLYQKLELNEDVLNVDNFDKLADGQVARTDVSFDFSELVEMQTGVVRGLLKHKKMAASWKKGEGDKAVYKYIDGTTATANTAKDFTQSFRDAKVPKQTKEVFNFALQNFFKVVNPDIETMIRSKGLRLTVRKMFSTVRDLVGGSDGIKGEFVPTANKLVVDTKNFTSIAHEIGHFLSVVGGIYKDRRAVTSAMKDELEKVVPTYFKRIEKAFAESNPAFLSYAMSPEEIHSRLFEQLVSYRMNEANPEYHPLVSADVNEYYGTPQYLTELEMKKAIPVLEKYMQVNGTPLVLKPKSVAIKKPVVKAKAKIEKSEIKVYSPIELLKAKLAKAGESDRRTIL